MQIRAKPLAALAAFVLLPLHAEAQLTMLGQSNATGGGLGSVATVLTLSSPGGSTTETGCVAPDGLNSCGFVNSNVQTGSSQTQTQMLSAFPGLTGSNFRLFLNAAEPGNDNTITVNNLVVRLYSSSGTQVFSSTNFAAPMTLTNTLSGIGNFGFIFGLSGPDATALQAAILANPNGSFGVGANISDASGGLETISIGTSPGSTSVVPEPSTYLLMATGLGALFAMRRRRAT